MGKDVFDQGELQQDARRFDATDEVPCSRESVDWPFPDQLNFEMPAHFGAKPSSREELEAEARSVVPDYRSVEILFDPRHGRAGDPPSRLWNLPGEDVEFTVGVVSVVESGLTDHRLYISVLLDGQPVPARFLRRGDGTRFLDEEVNGTGAAFHFHDTAEIVDVRIDAEQLREGRAHELAILVKMGRPNHLHANVAERYMLFNGGFELAPSPCFAEGQVSFPTPEEEKFTRHIALVFKEAALVPSTAEDGEDLYTSLRVPPGARLNFDMLLYNSRWDIDGPAFAIPLLDGRPVGEPRFFRSAIFDDGLRSTVTVARRDTLEIAAPDTPGIYDLYLGIWYDATLPAEDPDGRPYLHNGREVEVRRGGTSNSIRIIVE